MVIVAEELVQGADDEGRPTLAAVARMWIGDRVVMGDLGCLVGDDDLRSLRCTFTAADPAEAGTVEVALKRPDDGSFDGRWRAADANDSPSGDGQATAELEQRDDGLALSITLAPR